MNPTPKLANRFLDLVGGILTNIRKIDRSTDCNGSMELKIDGTVLVAEHN